MNRARGIWRQSFNMFFKKGIGRDQGVFDMVQDRRAVGVGI